MRTLLRVSLLLCVASVAACGFQLRGSGEWPEMLNPVHITGINARDALYRELAGTLAASGVTVMRQPPEAQGATLEIRAVNDRRRTLSVTEAAQVSEYELVRSVEVRLRPVGAEAVDLAPLRARRVYLFDETSVLTSGEREAIEREAMNRDLVAQLQRRVAARATADGALRETAGDPSR